MAYRVAVLISGTGSNLQALLDAERAGELGAEVVLVVSDRPEAYGLQRGLRHGAAIACVPLAAGRQAGARRPDRALWERRLADVVAAFEPDLVLLSGFMRVLSAAFLARFPGRVINQHPALLPDGGGEMVASSVGLLPALRGAHVVVEALERGLPLTGCTVHRVTAAVDDGPVLAQAEVPILPGDTIDTLHERIKAQEQRLIVEVVRRLAAEVVIQ